MAMGVSDLQAQGLETLADTPSPFYQSNEYSVEVIQPAPGVAMPVGDVFEVGDRVEIMVAREEELSGRYVVNARGAIDFPLIGDVFLAGKNAEEVALLLENALKQGYLVRPKVSVKAADMPVFHILGQVVKPGSYVFRDGIDITQGALLAGGLKDVADLQSVQILRTRTDGSGFYERVPIDTPIVEGDIILVR